jgi:hypothetical protein
MKALTVSTLIAVVLAVAVQPVAAASIKKLVNDKVLADYCATVAIDSHTTTTLVARDGSKVTGTVHCEAEDRFGRNGDDDDGHRRGRGRDDDRRDD